MYYNVTAWLPLEGGFILIMYSFRPTNYRVTLKFSNIIILVGPSTPNVTSRNDVILTKGIACDVIVLNCSSTGNPTPQYRLLDAQHRPISEQYILASSDVNRNYTCEAYNKIRSMMHSNSSTYTVLATDNSTNNSYCSKFIISNL